MAIYRDKNGQVHKRLKSLDEPSDIKIADSKKFDRKMKQLYKSSKTYEHNQRILQNYKGESKMNTLKKFFSYSAICIVIAFISFNFRTTGNEKISAYILLISSVIIAICYTQKPKIKISTRNSISRFLEENDMQIRENAKYNRRLDWGIQKEINWKNTWNPLQPKEDTPIRKPFSQKIKTFFKFLGIMFFSFFYIALLESMIIVTTII